MRIYVIALIEGQGGLRVKRRDDTIVIRVLVVWPPPWRGRICCVGTPAGPSPDPHIGGWGVGAHKTHLMGLEKSCALREGSIQFI